MTLSDHEQRQLDEIELGLARNGRSMRIRPEPMSRAAMIAVRVLLGVIALLIAVVLAFSEADGLTLLIGCGLLATIVCLHRYDATHG